MVCFFIGRRKNSIVKIPKKIKINGIDYEVKIIKIDEVPPLMKNHANGETSFDKCVICLDSELSEQRIFQVFLHEIIHAIEWSNGLDSSENYIQVMSSGLFQVLKDNKFLKEN